MDRRMLTVVVASVCFLPSACFKQLDSLRLCSFVGVLSMVYITGVTTHEALLSRKEPAAGVELVPLVPCVVPIVPCVVPLVPCVVPLVTCVVPLVPCVVLHGTLCSTSV